MDRADPAKKHSILSGPLGDHPPEPDVVAAGGDIQQTAHPANRIGGLACLYEREDSGGVSVSRANQAAAFARISRSILSCLFSRRRRRSSARSSVLRPSSRLPWSRSSCLTQLRMAWAVGSNSLASASGLRPARTRSTICWRKADG